MESLPFFPEPLHRLTGSFCRFALIVIDTVSEGRTRASRSYREPCWGFERNSTQVAKPIILLEKFCLARDRIKTLVVR
jgi:hypothetical protein